MSTNYSIAGQQIADAIQAAVIAPGAERLHGYATLTGTRDYPEITVHTFESRADMDRALSDAYHGKFLSHLYPDVYVFGPDRPIRMYAVIEEDEGDA